MPGVIYDPEGTQQRSIGPVCCLPLPTVSAAAAAPKGEEREDRRRNGQFSSIIKSLLAVLRSSLSSERIERERKAHSSIVFSSSSPSSSSLFLLLLLVPEESSELRIYNLACCIRIHTHLVKLNTIIIPEVYIYERVIWLDDQFGQTVLQGRDGTNTLVHQTIPS